MAPKLEGSPVVRYLHQLERALKRQAGVTPEEALTDAREFLSQDLQSVTRSEPGISDQEIYAHFLSTFGTPEQVAESYGDSAEPFHSHLRGIAPQWRICCTRCGRSAPAAQAGITRIGARSKHKYVLGWCRDCRRPRWLRLQRDLERTNLTSELGVHRTGSDLRRRSHRPWLTIVSIVSIVALAIALSALLPWTMSVLFAAETNASSANPQTTPTKTDNGSFDPSLLFESLPSEWSIKSQFEVPAAQRAVLGQKLGGQIDSLSNNVLSDGKTDLQINVLTCPDEQQAQSVFRQIRNSKPDPRHAFHEGNSVVEFVVRSVEQARLANRVRYRLPILPKHATYEVRFDAMPLQQGAPMAWNELFNRFLQWQQPNQRRRAEAELGKLRTQFTSGNELRFQSSEQATWGFSPMPTEQVIQNGTLHASFDELPNRAGFPFVAVQSKLTTPRVAPLGPDDRRRFLGATTRWPVDAPEIKRLAIEITEDSASPTQAVDALLDWFTDASNFRYDGPTGSRWGVKQCLDQRFGRCWDYSDLMVTLCRARQIPARQVIGWLDMGRDHPGTGHVWVEVLTDDAWQQFDPTSGGKVGSDYLPFVVSDDGELSYCYGSPVSIRRTSATW